MAQCPGHSRSETSAFPALRSSVSHIAAVRVANDEDTDSTQVSHFFGADTQSSYDIARRQAAFSAHEEDATVQAVYAAAIGVDGQSSYDIAHLQAVFSAHEAEEDVTVQAAYAAATLNLVHPLSSPPSDALDSDLTDAVHWEINCANAREERERLSFRYREGRCA